MRACNAVCADVGQECSGEYDSGGELDHVDIKRRYGASIVNKCSDVRHRRGSPEEAGGVDADAAASGASISKANELRFLFLPKSARGIVLEWEAT
jgi:hypothetical protein